MSLIHRLLGVVGIAGACLLAGVGIIVMPAAALIGCLASGLLVGVIFGVNARNAADLADPGAGRAAWAGILVGAAPVIGLLVVVGMIALFGAPGSVAFAVVLATAAWLWWFNRRRAAAPSEPALQPPPELALEPARLTTTPPAEMSTEQLCLAWRQSYTVLQQTMPGPERDVIVGVRAGYLDELERRDQQGFSRWLESGARAGSDPSRYLAAGGEPEGTLR